MATLVLATVIITSYVGFTIFFFCSFLVLITPATVGFGYVADIDKFQTSLVQVLLWSLYAIPLISLVLSINWQLFSGFFSKLKDMVNFPKMIEYLEY